MSSVSKLSIIVPVLDEGEGIATSLDALARMRALGTEVIVVDGGSRDATIQRARLRADRVISAPRGRALQMNAGAAKAAGDVLLFLHADSRLPRDGYASLAEAWRTPGVTGGNFALRFDGADRFSRVLTAWYRVQRRAGIYYGDSTVWVRAAAFAALGGYRELPIMDDYDFVRRMERHGRTVCLSGPATTSSRRWRALGVSRTVLSWLVIRWLWIAGVPAERLAGLYRAIR
jgi:rSAM/selenodomain-associated transferase 2